MTNTDMRVKSLPVALLLAALLAAGLWALSPGITGPFLFDDFPNLQNLRELGDSFSRESIGRYLAAWQGNPGRPLAALSFLIEDHAWPSDPEAFKRNNLLWHLLVGLGVFALARRLARLAFSSHAAPVGAGHVRDRRAADNGNSSVFGISGRGHGPLPQGEPGDTVGTGMGATGARLSRPWPLPHSALADWIALAVLALWLLHPMQLSATMLVVQRMTVLANGLIVAGLLLYLRAVCDSRKPDWLAAWSAVAALGGFGALAFLAKENGPLIFAYATALNLTLLGPALARFPIGPRRLLWAGAAGMTLALIAALLWQVRDPAMAYAARDFTLVERLLSQPRIVGEYLYGILLPRLGGGGIYHDDFVVSRGLLQPWTTLPALLGVLTALALALRYRSRWPLAAFGVLWFAAGHLIESTVIPLELYFEHRNYLAMLGPLLALCAWLVNARGDLKRPLRGLLLAWIGLTAAIGHHVARTWGDAEQLATAWEAERPKSVRAVQLLASHYVQQGEYGYARNVLLNGMDRIPQARELAFQHALLQCMDGRAGNSTFEDLIDTAADAHWARVVPDVVMALRAHIGSAHCGEALTPARYRRLVESLLANPHYAGRLDAVAHLHYELARMYLDTDHPQASLAHFEAAYAAHPEPQTAINQAHVLLYLGRRDEALAALDRAKATPLPRFKRWLHDPGDQAAALRAAILRSPLAGGEATKSVKTEAGPPLTRDPAE